MNTMASRWLAVLALSLVGCERERVHKVEVVNVKFDASARTANKPRKKDTRPAGYMRDGREPDVPMTWFTKGQSETRAQFMDACERAIGKVSCVDGIVFDVYAEKERDDSETEYRIHLIHGERPNHVHLFCTVEKADAIKVSKNDRCTIYGVIFEARDSSGPMLSMRDCVVKTEE